MATGNFYNTCKMSARCSLLCCLTIICLLFISLRLWAETVEIKSHERVVNIVSDIWPGDINADGSGTYLELMQLVYGSKGYVIKHAVVPTRRAVAMINKGDSVDIMLADWDYKYLSRGGIYLQDMVMTPQSPLGLEYVIAVFPPSSKKTWQDIFSDASHRIGWVRGYNYQWHLNVEQHDTTRVLNNVQGMKMLLKGHLDCFIDDRDVFANSRKQQGFDENYFKTEVVMTRKLYPVFANTTRGEQLMQIYDQQMAALKLNGQIYQFYEAKGKNYLVVEQPEIDPDTIK